MNLTKNKGKGGKPLTEKTDKIGIIKKEGEENLEDIPNPPTNNENNEKK